MLRAIGLGPYNGGLLVLSRSRALRDLGWIHSVVIVVVIGPGIGVLVKVHKDVLDLSLFGWVHNHHYGRRVSSGGDKACCCGAWHWLMGNELITVEVIVIVDPSATIMSIEGLRI